MSDILTNTFFIHANHTHNERWLKLHSSFRTNCLLSRTISVYAFPKRKFSIRNPGKYGEQEMRMEDGNDRKNNSLWQDLYETISPLDSGSSPE
jgi:hypothetical protein